MRGCHVQHPNVAPSPNHINMIPERSEDHRSLHWDPQTRRPTLLGNWPLILAEGVGQSRGRRPFSVSKRWHDHTPPDHCLTFMYMKQPIPAHIISTVAAAAAVAISNGMFRPAFETRWHGRRHFWGLWLA